MVKINDMQKYLSGMAATVHDKCWWLDNIPASITDVVDFGCANGDLAEEIHRIAPERKLRYFGVDNSAEMLRSASYRFRGMKNTSFYGSIEDALRHVNVRSTVLVLNSVLHEVFSYLSEREQNELLYKFFNSGFCYIAIRDMHMPQLPFVIPGFRNELSTVECSPYAKQWEDFQSVCDRRGGVFMDPVIRFHEFLLKYRYTSNWDREVEECYLWDWTKILRGFCGFAAGGEHYETVYQKTFFIPYISQRVASDFGITWNEATHKKMLLCKAAT